MLGRINFFRTQAEKAVAVCKEAALAGNGKECKDDGTNAEVPVRPFGGKDLNGASDDALVKRRTPRPRDVGGKTSVSFTVFDGTYERHRFYRPRFGLPICYFTTSGPPFFDGPDVKNLPQQA